MKKLSVIFLLVGIVSCRSNRSKTLPQIDSLPKPDTIVVAFVGDRGYSFARAARVVSKIPQITDTPNKKWDYIVDTSYILELPVNPKDTLRDSLHRPRFDKSGAPILRLSFSMKVNSPLPPYFWPLIPHTTK